MDENSIKSPLNRHCLLISIILCGLFISENAFSRQHWNRSYFSVYYDKADNVIVIRFKFFDYHFGPANENGYLEWCNFLFSIDGANFFSLMRCETKDQRHSNWSWLDMKDKYPGTLLQFIGCYEPANASIWEWDVPKYRIKVSDSSNKAYLTIKWFLDQTFHDVLFLRIISQWHVNGIYPNELIHLSVSFCAK